MDYDTATQTQSDTRERIKEWVAKHLHCTNASSEQFCEALFTQCYLHGVRVTCRRTDQAALLRAYVTQVLSQYEPQAHASMVQQVRDAQHEADRVKTQEEKIQQEMATRARWDAEHRAASQRLGSCVPDPPCSSAEVVFDTQLVIPESSLRSSTHTSPGTSAGTSPGSSRPPSPSRTTLSEEERALLDLVDVMEHNHGHVLAMGAGSSEGSHHLDLLPPVYHAAVVHQARRMCEDA